MLPISASVPSATPMISPMAPRIWASPIDATVSTSREDRANRRMTNTSTAAPVATPTATPTSDGDPVAPPLGHEEPDGERSRHGAHGAVGEVDDPRRAVDEDQAHRQQGVGRPEDHALGDDAPGHVLGQRGGRHPVEDDVGDRDGDRRPGWPGRCAADRGGGRSSRSSVGPGAHGVAGRSTTRSGATDGTSTIMASEQQRRRGPGGRTREDRPASVSSRTVAAGPRGLRSVGRHGHAILSKNGAGPVGTCVGEVARRRR